MKNIIKKILSCCMILTFMFSLSSCSSTKEVPDSVLKQNTKDILDNYYYRDYQDIECNWVSRAADKENHTENIVIDVNIKYEYGELHLLMSETFQYHKSDDLWNLVSFTKPESPSWVVYEDKILGHYEGEVLYGDIDKSYDKITHNFEVVALDMENFQITISGAINQEYTDYISSASYVYGPYYHDESFSEDEPRLLEDDDAIDPSPHHVKCVVTGLKHRDRRYPVRVMLSLSEGLYIDYPFPVDE